MLYKNKDGSISLCFDSLSLRDAQEISQAAQCLVEFAVLESTIRNEIFKVQENDDEVAQAYLHIAEKNLIDVKKKYHEAQKDFFKLVIKKYGCDK